MCQRAANKRLCGLTAPQRFGSGFPEGAVNLWGGAVNKSTRAPTGRGGVLAAGMADANGDSRADVWERLRGAQLSRDM